MKITMNGLRLLNLLLKPSCNRGCLTFLLPFLLLSLPSAAQDRLTITGSSTLAPLILDMAKRFESEHEGIRVDVQTGGSTRGIMDVRRKMADIGMVSRALKPQESDLQHYLVAKDGIGIILHSSNRVQGLSREQVIDIYTGKINNWQQVGGENIVISVINKAEGRSTLELFLAYFKLKNSQIKPQVIIGDNQQGIKTVLANRGAIAYVSIGTAEYEESIGAAIKRIAVDGEIASIENVRNGQFSLSRELNLVTHGKSSGLAQQFIRYTQSAHVHDIVRSQFFVPAQPNLAASIKRDFSQ